MNEVFKIKVQPLLFCVSIVSSICTRPLVLACARGLS